MTFSISLIQALVLLDNKEALTMRGDHKKSTFDLIRKTPKSIAEATKLANEILGKDLPQLSFTEKVCLLLIEAMVEKQAILSNTSLAEIRFTKRHVLLETRWSYLQVESHLKRLE